MQEPAELDVNAGGGEGASDEDVLTEEQMQAQELARREALLAGLSQALAKDRSAAISAREQSGIEDEWLEDEEFYQGVDDANRHEFKSSTWRKKPAGQSEQKKAEGEVRSTVFPNITGPYVDAAAARIADMLLPTDDRAWGIKPTPKPELALSSSKKVPSDMLRKAAAANPGNPEGAKQMIAQSVEEATRIMAEAMDKARAAERRIEDWHVECQYHAEVRQVIEDAARIGTGILKGPTPMQRTQVAYDAATDSVKIDKRMTPASRRIDPWNFYPDGACGENIQNGSGTWERDFFTRKQLRGLKGRKDPLGNPIYIDAQIDACITEGPQRAEAAYKETPEQLTDAETDRQFEVWYYYGTLEREHLEAAGCDCNGISDPNVPAMITMVNNRVIQAALNVLDTGEYPYDVMVWSKRSGHWAGQGVARKIRVPQRIVTAATRNLMDNAGLAGGPMIVFKQGKVYPANGKPGIAPRKVYYIAQDADEIDDATKAIGSVKVDMLVNELMVIINLGLKLAEDVTGLPMILQGQQGKAPDTVGGMQMLNNNANSILRRLAKLFDDRITEPHVRRYYVYLLMYGPDPEEKGDFQIDARGSSALVERDIQNQELAQMGAIVTNPVFGKDPKKWFDEYLRSRHFDPSRFNFDDDQWKQIVENMAKAPEDPRVAVAQLRGQIEEKLTQMELGFKQQENEKDRMLELILADFDQNGDFTQLKARLAETRMKLNTQTALSLNDNHARTLMKPPSEPAGRAQTGKAFVQ